MPPAAEATIPNSARGCRRLLLLTATLGLWLPICTASPGESDGSTLASLPGGRGDGATVVGDEACGACHAAKLHSFHDTAHFHTSSLPSGTSIHGKFTPEAATLQTINPNLTFTMEANAKGYFQTAHMKTSSTEELSRSERFDIVVGSGRKGQTYLFWDGDQLFQLPISYWTDLDGWVNSPGYIDGTADFDRPIVPRCLECHATSHVSRQPPENRYDPASLVLGVTCEKCHGPGSIHVARFSSGAPPKAPFDFAIVNPARLSRSKQLDICALCHEGAGESLQPALSFKPGDTLSEFIAFSKLPPHAKVDVHAAQVQLLKMSRCFRSTTTLTCTTCHDVHLAQRDPAPFSAKCLACHKLENCGEFAKRGHAIEGRCVDCHMPLQETGKIVSRVDGQTVRPMVRNHHIAVYPESTLP